mmetsp:Transcript_31336/g.86140  ORF Transcript_31336/g.86140 Transcript_31336/m.86140 type:complete len:217 (+) Transcript_31336:128-778(+)
MHGFFDETEHSEREYVFEADGVPELRQKVLGWSYGECNVAWNDCMCWFALHNGELFRGKSVLELGSGCGLVGLVVAHFADRVTLSDGDEAELPLLQRNVELYSPPGCQVRASLLDWGSDENQELFDVVIGQEVAYLPACVPLLAKAIKRCLHPEGHAYIGNKHYATNTSAEGVKRLFLEALREEGLIWEDLPLTFLPPGRDLAPDDPTYVLHIRRA